MLTREDKVKINARVPKILYDWASSEYGGVSQAVNDGLELLKKSKAGGCDTMAHKTGSAYDSVSQSVSQPVNNDLELLQEQIAGGCDTMYDNVSHEPTSQSDELSHELKEALDTLRAAEKNYETQQARIDDMKAQVQTLYEQLHIKDEQLRAKDNQIKDQNENMHKQAVHIQTLIQENSRLNVKLLPETTESNKPWWKFW